jgi:hypothetical protein
MLKRNQPLIRKTPLKRNTEPKENDPALAAFYSYHFTISTWHCQNCNAYIPHSHAWQLFAAQCHILDKDKYPEVRGNILNRLHLCAPCHMDWDSSWAKARKMPIFFAAKKLVLSFADQVTSAPLPEVFTEIQSKNEYHG